MKIVILASVLLNVVSLDAQPLDLGIKELASQISTSAAKQEKKRIAVLPFRELDGQPTVLGTYLAEALVTNLFQLGNFKIVERQMLDKVLGELKIQQTGAIDPSTAKEIGRITAVDAIVTGSITELGNHIAVNCRLIDTTTGEVFGAAQTRITKDEDVVEISRATVNAVPGPANARAAYQSSKAIATKDIGVLRVHLKSILPLSDDGNDANGVRLTFELTSREARASIVVAMNAETPTEEGGGGVSFGYARSTIPLRATLADDRGGRWTTSTTDLGGISFVRAGVRGQNGQEIYAATEIATLLRKRDELGRETDDPADGVMARHDVGADGPTNVTFDTSRAPSPEQFFRFRGNRFVSGSLTTIEPGQSVMATIDFRRRGHAGAVPTFVQFNSEIVVGVGSRGTARSYSLHSLTFDRIGFPAH